MDVIKGIKKFFTNIYDRYLQITEPDPTHTWKNVFIKILHHLLLFLTINLWLSNFSLVLDYILLMKMHCVTCDECLKAV